MTDNFNTYIKHIDTDAWRGICVGKGMLRRYAKGADFVTAGYVGRYVGYIKSGTLKYVAYSTDGTEHVMGLVFGEGFVADWPFCLYGKTAKLSIVAVTDCEIYCVSAEEVKKQMDSAPPPIPRCHNALHRGGLHHRLRPLRGPVRQDTAATLRRTCQPPPRPLRPLFAERHRLIPQHHAHPPEPTTQKREKITAKSVKILDSQHLLRIIIFISCNFAY